MAGSRNLGIDDNGWRIVYTPDFIECFLDDGIMSRIYPKPDDSRKRIIKAISDLCKSASPGSRKYPRKGRIKWFKGAGKIRELDLPNKNYDARLLWSCRHKEISLIAITNHKGMIKISRSATARVHSTPIDEYDLSDSNVLKIIELEDKEKSDADIASEEVSLDEEIANSLDGFGDEKFQNVLSRIAVWENTTHGQEIKLTEEQHQAVNHPTPMLLPGVAGTGKSTVLQKRFRNDLEKWLSKRNKPKSDQKQPSHMIYLTVNPNLAAHTIEEMRRYLPDWIILEELVMSLESWLLRVAEAKTDTKNKNRKQKYPEEHKIDFYYFRNWFKNQPNIRSNFDPAQLWEEYRGVLRGSEKSLGKFLPKKEYVNLAKNRGVFEKSERMNVYPILKQFDNSLDSEKWLDQELAAHVFGLGSSKKFSHIYVDEVQDLTELQTRVLISRLPEEKGEFGAFDLTGDVSQQVYPSGFRWEDIGKMLHQIRGINITPSPPLNINYRSGKNLIDLANWTLSEMDERNRISSGAELQQAYAANDGAMPSIFVESESQLIGRLVKSGLPKADSPVIVRDDKQVDEIKKQIEKAKENFGQFTEGGSRSEFVFTVAQAKGLEFSHVILWDIGRGSNNLLKRAYHTKKGEYLEEEEWNIQLELRHLFVGITRSRVLLLLVTQNDTPEFKYLGGNPLDQTLLSEGVLAIGDDDDFTRLAETSMNAEELLKMAESYANQGMFDAAYAAAQEAGNEESATRYKQKHLEQNLEYYEAAKIARERGKYQEASKLAEEAVNTSSENVLAAVLLEELYSLLGEKVKASEMKAKRYNQTAQKTKAKKQAKMLFSLAAEEWGKIGNFSDSAAAWSKAKDHIKSAEAYQKIEDYLRLREEVVSFIKKNHGNKKESIRVAIIYLLGDKATKIAPNWDLNSQLGKVSTSLQKIEAKQEISADLQQALRFAESKYGDKELAKKIQALDLEDISNPDIRARRLLQLGRKKDAAKIYYENGNFKEAFDTFVIDGEVDEKGQVQLLKNEEFEGIEPRIKLANWWYEYLKSTDKEGAYNKALDICSQNAPTNMPQIRKAVNRISKKENSSTLEERMILSKLLSRYPTLITPDMRANSARVLYQGLMKCNKKPWYLRGMRYGLATIGLTWMQDLEEFIDSETTEDFQSRVLLFEIFSHVKKPLPVFKNGPSLIQYFDDLLEKNQHPECLFVFVDWLLTQPVFHNNEKIQFRCVIIGCIFSSDMKPNISNSAGNYIDFPDSTISISGLRNHSSSNWKVIWNWNDSKSNRFSNFIDGSTGKKIVQAIKNKSFSIDGDMEKTAQDLLHLEMSNSWKSTSQTPVADSQEAKQSRKSEPEPEPEPESEPEPEPELEPEPEPEPEPQRIISEEIESQIQEDNSEKSENLFDSLEIAIVNAEKAAVDGFWPSDCFLNSTKLIPPEPKEQINAVSDIWKRFTQLSTEGKSHPYVCLCVIELLNEIIAKVRASFNLSKSDLGIGDETFFRLQKEKAFQESMKSNDEEIQELVKKLIIG